jgi:hypothetical protein
MIPFDGAISCHAAADAAQTTSGSSLLSRLSKTFLAKIFVSLFGFVTHAQDYSMLAAWPKKILRGGNTRLGHYRAVGGDARTKCRGCEK